MAPPTPIRSSDIDRLFGAAIERFGKLDIVVANTGVEVVDQAAVDFTEADYDRVFGINTKGAFSTLQQADKHVADGGRIIYLGSSTTAFPTPGHGLYGGSKIAPPFLVEVLRRAAAEVRQALLRLSANLPAVECCIWQGNLQPQSLCRN